MDALLAKEFQRLGGDLRERARWKASAGEGIVHSTGRRPRSVEEGWRWFGVKVHARDVALAADLEMYAGPNCYVGINRIDGGAVNVCGLFRARGRETTMGSRLEWLRGAPDTPLFERLRTARFDESSFCSVGGLSLQPCRATGRDDLRLGDALTMIPPVTGNGMSMAFEAAEMAIEPLVVYSRGALTWPEARETIARACDAAFSERLVWARRLQRLMFSPWLSTAPGGWMLNSDWLWRTMWTRTR